MASGKSCSLCRLSDFHHFGACKNLVCWYFTGRCSLKKYYLQDGRCLGRATWRRYRRRRQRQKADWKCNIRWRRRNKGVPPKKKLKGGEQDWHTAQSKDMMQKGAGLFGNLFAGAGLQTNMLIYWASEFLFVHFYLSEINSFHP